jgi:predicted regulator of amino acid metabolism with ACT domain
MTDAQRLRVLRLHRSGVPASHIARRMGVPRRVVNKVLREVVDDDRKKGNRND